VSLFVNPACPGELLFSAAATPLAVHRCSDPHDELAAEPGLGTATGMAVRIVQKRRMASSVNAAFGT